MPSKPLAIKFAPAATETARSAKETFPGISLFVRAGELYLPRFLFKNDVVIVQGL